MDKWTTMDEVFSSIMFYADQSNKTKIYTKPEYEGESTIQVSEDSPQARFPPGSPKRTIIHMERQVSKTRSQ